MAKEAAATLQEMPEIEEPGVTAVLFPEFMEEDEKKESLSLEDKAEEKTVPEEPETKETKPLAEEVLTEKPAPEVDFLSVEDYGDKMVKLKVDGEEIEVSFADMQRRYQTDKALTQRGQKLAAERKAFEEQTVKTPAEVPIDIKSEEEEYLDPETKQFVTKETDVLKKEIATLKDTLDQMSQVTGPMQYQTDLGEINNKMKEQGFDDFMEYIPKIENVVFTASPEEQATLHTYDGYIKLYQQFKLQDMKALLNKPKDPEVLKADERATPKVVPIESASGRPTGTDDSNAAIEVAMEKAKLTGDWLEVLRLKGL